MKKQLSLLLLRLSRSFQNASDEHRKNTIKTYTGLELDLLDPKHQSIVIEDISRGLSTNPYNMGHTKVFFSLASYSLLLESLVSLAYPEDYNTRLAALLYCSNESYIRSNSLSENGLIYQLKDVSDNIQKVVFERYYLKLDILELIKPFDKVAKSYVDAHFEYNNNSELIKSMSIDESNKLFLNKFYLLVSKQAKH